MAQNITTGIATLCKQAKSEIREIDAAKALEMQTNDGALIVDIRDIRELWRDGCIPEALHAPRGMLEFWIDPDSPYHKEAFAADRPFIFCCAGGMRSALATQIAQQMGMQPVFNLIGGFKAWKEAEFPVKPHEKRN